MCPGSWYNSKWNIPFNLYQNQINMLKSAGNFLSFILCFSLTGFILFVCKIDLLSWNDLVNSTTILPGDTSLKIFWHTYSFSYSCPHKQHVLLVIAIYFRVSLEFVRENRSEVNINKQFLQDINYWRPWISVGVCQMEMNFSEFHRKTSRAIKAPS